MVNFFLKRPVFAWVLAIAVMLAGVLAINTLPIQRYPTVAPPAVEIQASYPGASSDTVSNTVVQVIEQEMTGLDGLLYMGSTSDSTGHATITLTFASGTDPDIAQVQVQNKLALAEPRLPTVVRQQGISVEKASESFLLVKAFISGDGEMTKQAIADFVHSDIKEPIARVTGVGSVTVFGSEYAMRIWLDPDALIRYGLTVSDVRSAIETQNAQVTAGQFGGLPAVEGQQLNATVTSQTLLNTPEEFRNILIKTQPDGSRVRLGDIARVALGGGSTHIDSFYNGQPAAGLAVTLAPGANSLETTRRVEAGRRPGRHPGARRELPGDHPARGGTPQRARTLLPEGPRGRHPLRDRPLRRGLDGGGGPHPDRGHRPRGAGDDPVPAELAGHADPDAGGAGGAARHLRGDGSDRVLHQHADHVRYGPGDRATGRRRHRRGGERRTRHA